MSVTVELDLPSDLQRFTFPTALNRRLHVLLDRQDQGSPLSEDEQQEATAIVNLAELMTLLKLRSESLQP